MNHFRTITILFLNVLFCLFFLYFFTLNTFLRPFAGGFGKEILAGMMLLISIYANYFLVYPKLYRHHIILYWIIVIFISLLFGCLEMIIAYPAISHNCAMIIQTVGEFRYFSKHTFLVVGRNIALNLIPFVIKEKGVLKELANSDMKILYNSTNMIDAADSEHKSHLMPTKDIYYCWQTGNYINFRTINNEHFFRYSSMKYMFDLLGEENFVRISSTIMLPYRYILTCDGEKVRLIDMPWEKKPYIFQISFNKKEMVSRRIAKYFEHKTTLSNETLAQETEVASLPRNLKIIYNCIKANPGIRTPNIVIRSACSQSSIERYIAELRKLGLIEYVGSKKTGGYQVCQKSMANSPANKQ